jgi:ubiquinone/menaquinone biosynthesis C-methylase UbiE
VSGGQEDVLRYYGQGLEEGRLALPYFRWEKIRTIDLMDRFLPQPPAVVLDVGGGAGAYAFGLAEKGYVVDLIDPVELHIEQAKVCAANGVPSPRSFQVGDARSIPAEDNSSDAVLMFGPLYHLTERTDRLKAIGEAYRTLRPGGRLMAVAISRFASALDGISRGLIRDAQFVRIVEEDLASGQHRNNTGKLEYFTTAFFHHPDEFRAELEENGFADPLLCAIEGPVWMPHAEADERDEVLMSMMRSMEREGTMIGASAHIMAIGTRVDR